MLTFVNLFVMFDMQGDDQAGQELANGDVTELPSGAAAAAVFEDGPVVPRQKARPTNALEQLTALPPGA